MNGAVPAFLTSVVGAAVIAEAFSRQAVALCILMGRPTWPRLRLGVITSVTIGAAFFTYVEPNVQARLVIVSLAIAALAALATFAVYGGRDKLRPPNHLTGAMFAASAIMLLVRAVVEATRSPWLTSEIAPAAMQSATYLFAAFVPLLTTVGFVLMCGDRLNWELRRLATLDSLTGIYNRGRFMELADRAMTEARRGGRPLSVIMFDVDHFKRINDSLGHEGGDRALRALARLTGQSLRNLDISARLGGEEFAVLMPGVDATAAAAAAERLRARVAGEEFDFGNGGYGLTISLGVASLESTHADLATLLRAADHALYAAKRGGRNRVAIAGREVHAVLPEEETHEVPFETSRMA
jgi:diguanylate cyclase (GGDEF)-like protein